MAAAIISTVDVSVFLRLVHRPGVDHFQTQITGLLYGAIGVVVGLAALEERPSSAAVVVGCLGALTTAVLEAIYLPYWAFFASPRFVSSLCVDLPYEAALAVILAPIAWRWTRDRRWLRWDRSALRQVALPSAIMVVVLAAGGLLVVALA